VQVNCLLRTWNARSLAVLCTMLLTCVSGGAFAQSETPVPGHYPPGQSGIRGASTPPVGTAYTNFSRFFTKGEIKDAGGDTVGKVGNLGFANISMFSWVSDHKILGMNYGISGGIPFSTKYRRTSNGDIEASGFALGDVLITPIALYGKSSEWDYQAQFTVWTPSGSFSPGAFDNHGAGFWALVYSLGGAYYPGGKRDDWSLSAVARIEQNFEQKGSGITPGDDIVIDWGIGKIVPAGKRGLDVGVSGFATWQTTSQTGGPSGVDTSRYRNFGIGPEVNIPASEKLAYRVRAQWEFGTRNTVQGNNLWFIVNYRL
jgi:hypothetical protein